MFKKEFFKQEDAMLSAEYVLFVAAVLILLAVGVGVLFNSMSNYFASWEAFFSGGG
jgi:hypothetical protein